MAKLFPKFTKFEIGLWAVSVVTMTLGFLIAKQGILQFIASLVGVTGLIFHAKANVVGPILLVVFSALYGIISLQNHYYGEMITYLCMTAPMEIFSIIEWLKHPHQESAEVEICRLSKGKKIGLAVSTVFVTVVFYFILSALNTASIWVSTLSVTTSFFAAALTFFRNPYYAFGYVFNDIVLIVLWVIACGTDISNLVMVACFVMFLANDLYAFINWKKLQKRQNVENEKKENNKISQGM
jgi:nicotinamide mononucleotide transporter PnuC